MGEIPTNTEQNILNAAKKVFIEKGRQGTRMQEIANEAGINKALLHYYFRSKEKLFEAVFLEAFHKFLPQIEQLVESDRPFFEVLKFFIDNYINLIFENPHIPGFILHELSQNPDSIARFMSQRVSNLPKLYDKIEKEMTDGIIKPMDPRQILINLIGLCVFPFVAKPIVKSVFFQNDEEVYQSFLLDRKYQVYDFIVNSIKT
nr:TetR/AcrR family transcriptional regulator [Bacteroidota bacterium]